MEKTITTYFLSALIGQIGMVLASIWGYYIFINIIVFTEKLPLKRNKGFYCLWCVEDHKKEE